MTEEAVTALLEAATARLAAAGVESPRHDAETLLAHATGLSRRDLLTRRHVDPAAAAHFTAVVDRRIRREPLQHITGSVGFRYLELEVGPGVFVPRPETEVVAQAAVDAAHRRGNPVVVDLCSGSGVIALSVAHEVPGATVHAVELDPDALVWLHRNAAARASAGDRPIQVHHGDAAHALPELDGRVDVVVSNPPYVAAGDLDRLEPEVRVHDPQRALVAGDDGLALVRAVTTAAWRLLRPGGALIVEHSDWQGAAVPQVLEAQGFADVADHPDLTGRDRYATGRRP